MLLLMIDIICKLLVLLKNHLNYLKDNLSECFFNKHKKKYFFNYFFHDI